MSERGKKQTEESERLRPTFTGIQEALPALPGQDEAQAPDSDYRKREIANRVGAFGMANQARQCAKLW